MDPNRCIEKENCMFDQGRSNSKSMGGGGSAHPTFTPHTQKYCIRLD